MFYHLTTSKQQWYKIEARRLNPSELHNFYTSIGGNILHITENIEQIVLTNTSDTVMVYFTSSLSKSEVESHFDDSVELCTVDPLTLWSENNTGESAYQIKHESQSTEVEFQQMDIKDNRTILKKLVSELESEQHDTDSEKPSRFISMSIMFDILQDVPNSSDVNEPLDYFCRPVEIIADSHADTLLTRFSSLNTSNHHYAETECSLKKATYAIVHGAISYRGKNTISLVGEDLRFVLEK